MQPFRLVDQHCSEAVHPKMRKDTVGANTRFRDAFLVATLAGLVACGARTSPDAGTDVVALLAANDVATVDTYLNGVQQRFEEGSATEIELRNAFRPVYDLTGPAAENLHGWAASHPDSYAAHLAEGIFLKKRGLAARGDKFISETSQSQLDEMRRYFGPSKAQLERSRALTKKPLLSIFHLLDIASNIGTADESLALVNAADTMAPGNALARNRYLQGLMPRWGGSYPQAEAFIVKSKDDGAPEDVILQMQAILHDDKGRALETQQDHDAAVAEFEKALELGRKVGGAFQQDFLTSSRYYVCSGPNAANYCL
jgi:tetratricopeptide (TPR) repeat protein